MPDILTRKGILLLNQGSRIRQSLGTVRVFFLLYIGNSANHTFEQQILINQVHIKQCLLSNQTIECALLISFVSLYCFWKPEKEFRKTIKKNSGWDAGY